MSKEFPDSLFVRARELRANGLEHPRAFGEAWLEERVRQWPAEWGDNLRVLLYGDFSAPASTLRFPLLGITVHPEQKTSTIIRGALTVLEANVTVSEKSVSALIDAARRINLLLGVLTLHQWGNAGCGWWSWVTHDSGAGVMATIEHEGFEQSAAAVLNLPPDVRQKVEAALFWVREPKNLLLESYRTDVLRVYSAYWNAFECLVDAICVLSPRPISSKSEKQSQIDEFLKQRDGCLTPAEVQECYQNIVNPGLVGNASHAISACFGADGDRYIDECFRCIPKVDRLYDIRNAINHGEIDAENPSELLRVQTKLQHLWMIVWRMFGRLIPFSAPVG